MSLYADHVEVEKAGRDPLKERYGGFNPFNSSGTPLPAVVHAVTSHGHLIPHTIRLLLAFLNSSSASTRLSIQHPHPLPPLGHQLQTSYPFVPIRAIPLAAMPPSPGIKVDTNPTVARPQTSQSSAIISYPSSWDDADSSHDRTLSPTEVMSTKLPQRPSAGSGDSDMMPARTLSNTVKHHHDRADILVTTVVSSIRYIVRFSPHARLAIAKRAKYLTFRSFRCDTLVLGGSLWSVGVKLFQWR